MPRPSRVVDFSGHRGSWAWLEEDGDQVSLWEGGPGRRRKVSAGKDWMEVSRAGTALWVLRGGARPALLRVEAGTVTEAAANLRQPGGLLAAEGRVAWIETEDRVPGAWGFVPAAGPTSRLQVLESATSAPVRPRTVAEWPGARAWPEDLFALTEEAAYVRVQRAGATEFLRVPLNGTPPTRLAVEGGPQQAVVHEGRLYWTAPSEEVMPTLSMRCLRTADAAGPRTLTDWLLPSGRLLSFPDGLFYANQYCYRLPTEFGPPVYVGQVAAGIIRDDGRTVVALQSAEPPSAAPLERR